MHVWAYAKALVYIFIFYVNYYYIIERSIEKPHKVLRFLGYNLLVVLTALLILYLIWRYWGDQFHIPGKKIPKRLQEQPEYVRIARWTSSLLRDVVMIVFTVGLAVALRLGDKWKQLSQQKKDLVSAQREEELKNLKSQLNPHFLFNTLNSIYALIAISPTKAQDAVHELSRLLRYVLYDTPTSVTVRQEIDFINNYVKLMRLRLKPSLDISVNLDAGNCANSTIAPLLFITVIENVFKHGIHNSPEDKIEIDIIAADGMIKCHTSNTMTAESHEKATQGGIGMQNLRRRLQLLYGDRAIFDVSASGTTYSVNLTIPLDHVNPEHTTDNLLTSTHK
ncbi:MAG: sensor histidine kinase [Duncaniella sp.]|nr:sensor histidine kinase [Duncaniella sp.]